ncbi:ATPase AAA [Chlorella sorokiniana]|uniref:ATPase AAA n=1 Tax=Chlorella sorokiniana TaxID=3076 RepID=A0A2P6TCB4_CHLSO|nr:ATPase AAA [Chlorella sorokiniana]|eukprot:PRW20273.1 ATPase AAA [Chlorella sorokiniana]
MDPCWDAPDSNLCTTACKDQLNKLPDKCLERLADSVAAQGNANVTERLSEQLEACGRNITITPTNAAAGLGAGGALLVPLLVLALSLLVAELLFQP